MTRMAFASSIVLMGLATVGPASRTPPAPTSISPSERRVILMCIWTCREPVRFAAELAGLTRPALHDPIIGER